MAAVGLGMAELAEKLGLAEYFPGKLTIREGYTLVNASLTETEPKKLSEVGMYFLYRLLSCNYQARDIHLPDSSETESKVSPLDIAAHSSKGVSKGKNSPRVQALLIKAKSGGTSEQTPLHPLDVLKTVFLCCDSFLRQDLTSILWKCKLAIPLVAHLDRTSTFYLWPLRGLTAQWKEKINGQWVSFEKEIASQSMPICSFVKLKNPCRSKSSILNNVLSEKGHPTFYNRDCVGSTKKRRTYDGTIETSWYLPKGNDDDAFDHPVMFLNLRGDATRYTKELKIVKEMSSVLIIFSDAKDLQETETAILEDLLKSEKKFMLLLTDNEIGNDVTDILTTLAIKFRHFEDKYEALCAGHLNSADLIELIREFTSQHSSERFLLEEATRWLKEEGVNVDEHDGALKQGIQVATQICKAVRETPKETRRDLLLPVHGKLWQELAETEQEIYQLHQRPKRMDIDKYREQKKVRKNAIRNEQFQLVQKGFAAPFQQFLDVFTNSSNANFKGAFLRKFLYELSAILRQDLPQMNATYSAKKDAHTNATSEGEKRKAKEELDTAQAAIDNAAIGLEHFLREMGQIYEALVHQGAEEEQNFKYKLPGIAVDILLHGFPVEIMDGNIGAVPSIWIKAVLKRLELELTNREKQPQKVHVMSVFGIQSSGKSTLLNTMFGMKFPVRSGKCTRGAQMQLVRVSKEIAKQIHANFFLTVDTEGIKSPESSELYSEKHDNELATFVIGLGHMTIINLFGENITHLKDILPITVHSFLRMESVGLQPNCLIVYQNVDGQSSENLKGQNLIMEQALNEMTEIACEKERKPVKLFKEVIGFDIQTDVYFVTSLWEGAQPMAPISVDYSKGVRVVKKKMLCEDELTNSTFTDFGSHVQTLWTCIVKDDFVYDFKNTMEMQARSKLDAIWCDVLWAFNKYTDECASKTFREVQNCNDIDNLKTTTDNLPEKLRSHLQEKRSNLNEKLEEEFQRVDKKYQEFVRKWQPQYSDRLKGVHLELQKELLHRIKTVTSTRKDRLELENKLKEYEDKIKEEILQYFKDERKEAHAEMTGDEQERIFTSKWNAWVEELTTFEEPIEDDQDMKTDAIETLTEFFQAHNQMVLDRFEFISTHPIEPFRVEERHFSTDHLKIQSAIGEPETVLQEFVSRQFHRVKDELKKVTILAEPHSRSTFEDVVKLVQVGDAFTGHQFKVTMHFEVDFAVSACVYALEQLKDMRRSFYEENAPRAILNRRKAHFFQLFKHHLLNTSTASLIAGQITEAIRDGIWDEIREDFAHKAADNMRSKGTYYHILGNKKRFLFNILSSLAEDDDFKGFVEYIQNPEVSIEVWLGKYVDKYFCDKTDKTTKSKVMLDIMVSESLVNYQNAIQETRTKFNKKKTIALQSWFETLEKQLRASLITKHFNRIDFKKNATLEIDTEFMAEELCSSVGALRDKLIQNFEDLVQKTRSEYSSMRSKIIEKLKGVVIGCTEACPFCKEICICANAEHGEGHLTPVHRPQGCGRYRWLNNNHLIVESCQVLVASDRTFRNEKTNQLPKNYKDYNKFYPEWLIPGDPNPAESTFWEWFMITYASKLAAEYKAVVPQFPPSWKDHKKSIEIQKLQEQMKH